MEGRMQKNKKIICNERNDESKGYLKKKCIICD